MSVKRDYVFTGRRRRQLWWNVLTALVVMGWGASNLHHDDLLMLVLSWLNVVVGMLSGAYHTHLLGKRRSLDTV